MKKSSAYEKFTYWIEESDLKNLTAWLKTRKTRLRKVKTVPCIPMHAQNKISLVPPEAWNAVCKRQGSWYRSSDRAGLFLVVSSFPLDPSFFALNTHIRSSDFVLPGEANMDELESLTRSDTYRKTEPEEWRVVSNGERRRLQRSNKKTGYHKDIERILLIQSANHANFMEPVLFHRQGKHVVPYSIAPTAFLCSACIEFFNVLGRRFNRKLVAPCPGAVAYAALEENKYLEVCNEMCS